MTVVADGSKTIEPQGFGVASVFVVTSGPCTTSQNGRCVGRPDGYGPSEECAITVGGGGGVLGRGRVFDLHYSDCLTLRIPGAFSCIGSDQVGVALAPGDAISWHSDGNLQGSTGSVNIDYDNGCAAKGTCGLPYSAFGLGGGWELCFA